MGSDRYILGYLTVSSGGTQVSFAASTSTAVADPRMNASGSVVNFGAVQTDGMISLTQSNGQWVLRPYPRFRNFTVLLSSSQYPAPTIVQTDGATSSTVVPIEEGGYWKLPLNNSKTYSWPVN